MKKTLFLAYLISLCCCNKKDTSSLNPCVGLPPPSANFAFKEILNDTSFYSDTIYNYNSVNFVALTKYENIIWNVGNDPRTFTQPSFNLRFFDNVGTHYVNFVGTSKPNTICFPKDSGIYRGLKQLTIVEFLRKPLLKVSPLVGAYKGALAGGSSDSFIVRINYFDSAKYSTALTGEKNFYWISNFPNGFVSTSNVALVYPELRFGRDLKMGYKSFEFGQRNELAAGWCRGWLTNDTLTVLSSGNSNTEIKKFIGKRIK